MPFFSADEEKRVKGSMVSWRYLEQETLPCPFQTKDKETTNAGLLQQNKKKKVKWKMIVEKKQSFPDPF